jgi:Protein of unknown function (DUF1579)
MRRISILILFTILSLAMIAAAQMPMPKPAPELKKLDYFAGDWRLDGDMKPNPMGPGGKTTLIEHNKWMEGGFFLVSNSEFKSAGMGNGSGISFMGYSSEEKTYTYDEYNSMGEAVHSKGTLDGDAWTWTATEKMNGQTMKGRFTIKTLSDTSYSFKYEISQDGTNWITAMDGKATKVK